MTDAHRRAAVAERAARAGGAVARGSFREALWIEAKADKTDLVTDADRDAQRQVVATVLEEFPTDAIVGEEDAVPLAAEGEREVELEPSLPDAGDAWVVDPIDGTSNYARGLRLWATSVAAVVDGETVAAATFLPTVEDVYAVGPESATRNGESLSVSDREDPETFAAAVVGSFDRSAAARFGDACGEVVAELGDFRRFGSMQATLAFVAAGELDATLDPAREAPWDTLAGVRLVRAAGGTVTDFAGDPWTLDSEGLVASNGRAHDAVVDVASVAVDDAG